MIRYIGTSISSHITKNSIRSSAMNTPSMPVVSTSSSAKYACSFSLTLVQPPRTASGIMSVVSRMSINEMPSMPSVTRMPHIGIQGRL